MPSSPSEYAVPNQRRIPPHEDEEKIFGVGLHLSGTQTKPSKSQPELRGPFRLATDVVSEVFAIWRWQQRDTEGANSHQNLPTHVPCTGAHMDASLITRPISQTQKLLPHAGIASLQLIHGPRHIIRALCNGNSRGKVGSDEIATSPSDQN
ncbi:hypothetical protein CSAL01_09939 [Colletotrichum salicis]|uniref:Uncharacterized protein n=1 Tax=Colletotrichum salicis TaxID=1209931 RepID=A0A135UY01_9PEZI|nr:hypothetical protein CSAL01_09939 [Colletotrichum salicis]